MVGRIVEPTAAYDYGRLQRDVALLTERYRRMRSGTAGCSAMGKELTYLKLGEGSRRVHINASFHANEWITSLALMTVMEELAAADVRGAEFAGSSACGLLADNTLWVVPMVNPDGVDVVLHGVGTNHPYQAELLNWNGGSADFSGWKANIRGVDLNDQFPAGWDIERARRAVCGPGPRDYGGEAPLTEPEALALAALAEAAEFHRAVALHTQGREIYWNYRGYEPTEAEPFAARLAAASGYEPVKLEDSDAGYKDWFLQRFRRPGFTVELGCGVNPLPLSQLPQLVADTRAIVHELLLD